MAENTQAVALRLALSAVEEDVEQIDELQCYSDEMRARLLHLEAEIMGVVDEAGEASEAWEELEMEFRGGRVARAEQPPADYYGADDTNTSYPAGAMPAADASYPVAAAAPGPTMSGTGAAPAATASAGTASAGTASADTASSSTAAAATPSVGSASTGTAAGSAGASGSGATLPKPVSSTTNTTPAQYQYDTGKSPADTFESQVGTVVFFENPTTYNSVVVRPNNANWKANMKEGSIVVFKNGLLANVGPVSYSLPLYEHSLETEDGSPVQGLDYFRKVPQPGPGGMQPDPKVAPKDIFAPAAAASTVPASSVSPKSVRPMSVDDSQSYSQPASSGDTLGAATAFVKATFLDPLWGFIEKAIRNPQLDSPSQTLADDDALDAEDMLLYAARLEVDPAADQHDS